MAREDVMHATLQKFDYPQTLLYENKQWCVLLRPQQVTLAALVLCAKDDATSLASLPAAAFHELSHVTARIESALHILRPFDKLNYLALMMVDPQVHFHVLPRYASAQDYAGITFMDTGWPGPPDLKHVTVLPEVERAILHAELVDAFAAAR